MKQNGRDVAIVRKAATCRKTVKCVDIGAEVYVDIVPPGASKSQGETGVYLKLYLK